MSKAVGKLIVSVGGATLAISGATAKATGIATVVAAGGAALGLAALGGLVGYGLYRYYSSGNARPSPVPGSDPIKPLPLSPGGGQVFLPSPTSDQDLEKRPDDGIDLVWKPVDKP